MNSLKLQYILERIIKPPCKFLGVFAKDKIPLTMTSYPCCFVANTDISSMSGEHWVAYFYDSPQSYEFFDSYGMPPQVYGFVSVNNYNRKSLQSLTSSVCGQFCLFYLYLRSRGFTLNQILNSFSSSDSSWNDFQVARYAKKHFAVNNSPAFSNFICSQSCVSRNLCKCLPHT